MKFKSYDALYLTILIPVSLISLSRPRRELRAGYYPKLAHMEGADGKEEEGEWRLILIPVSLCI